jgi:hypothetical protein
VPLPEALIATLLVAAIVVGLLALTASVLAIAGQQRLRRAYARFAPGTEQDVIRLLERYADETRALRADVAQVRADGDELRTRLRSTLSRVGTVRYDAFGDMGGRMSFSTALLDERGDGVVLTAISGRSETRTYAKALVGGRCRDELSAEEQQAVERAMELRGRSGDEPQPGVRTRLLRRLAAS